MKKLIAFMLVLFGIFAFISPANADEYNGPSGSAHVAYKGWLPWQPLDGSVIGTTGESRRIEGLMFPGSIQGEAHVKDLGWIEGQALNCADGCTTFLGTTGQSRRIEAIILRSDLYPNLTCQAHVKGLGWLKPVKIGEVCGTTGQSRRAEAFIIKVNEK